MKERTEGASGNLEMKDEQGRNKLKRTAFLKVVKLEVIY